MGCHEQAQAVRCVRSSPHRRPPSSLPAEAAQHSAAQRGPPQPRAVVGSGERQGGAGGVALQDVHVACSAVMSCSAAVVGGSKKPARGRWGGTPGCARCLRRSWIVDQASHKSADDARASWRCSLHVGQNGPTTRATVCKASLGLIAATHCRHLLATLLSALTGVQLQVVKHLAARHAQHPNAIICDRHNQPAGW